MTYLEIVQKAWRLVPMNGAVPATVATPTSLSQEGQVLLDMIDDAWTTLKNERQDWRWLRQSISFNTIGNKQLYTPADLASFESKVTDIVRWDRSQFRFQRETGEDDLVLICRHEDDFEDLHTRTGPYNSSQGHPIEISVSEDDSRSLRIYPVPDDAYAIHGRFWFNSGALSADADVPELPSRFHDILVWKAVQSMGEYMGKDQAIRQGRERYERHRTDLIQNQTQKVEFANQPLVY